MIGRSVLKNTMCSLGSTSKILLFTTVIGDPPPQFRPAAIIFNMWHRDHLGSESACAFLRHAFGCFYNAFSKVDLEQKLFSPPLVFHKTLLSFRSAVLRYAQTIRILYIPPAALHDAPAQAPPPGIARPLQGPRRHPGNGLRL